MPPAEEASLILAPSKISALWGVATLLPSPCCWLPAPGLGSGEIGQGARGLGQPPGRGMGQGAASAVPPWLVGRSRLGLGSCSRKPRNTEPRRSLYFRGSDVQILCKALHYFTEPHRPPRIDVTSWGMEPARKRLSTIFCSPEGACFRFGISLFKFLSPLSCGWVSGVA